MGIEIENSIRYLTDIRKTYQADTEMISIAIDTMRKYQMFQADYEKRLREDMAAMLTKIQLEIEEEQGTDYHGIVAVSKGSMIDIIQEKINTLKEQKDES